MTTEEKPPTPDPDEEAARLLDKFWRQHVRREIESLEREIRTSESVAEEKDPSK